jgi:hypothetical protein
VSAYLIDHPGRLRQYSARTNWVPSRPTGCVVVHTTEFPPSWTVAQQAAWLRNRSDPGCYHDIADTHGGDLQLVPYEMGAWQDGTGSNGCALSIAFVCRTTDWSKMAPAERQRTLRAGARCFARQQAWLKAHGHPTTPLIRRSKAQSDAGQAGFIAHGERDPLRRTDPGTKPPNLFPWDEFFTECRAALAGTTTSEEDDMTPDQVRVLTETKNAVDLLVKVAERPLQAEARLTARIAALQAVVQQLADRQGSPVDLDAVEAAVEKGVADAIAAIETTVRVETGRTTA